MKKLILSILISAVWTSLHAQLLEGAVYDAKTRETIPGVAVYLDGTSTITTSDKDGNFKLDINQKINTNLIFSHLSYESLAIHPPFDRLGKAIYLKERENTLPEAKVVADRYSRAEKMRVFKEQFLGTSPAGMSCLIVNEEVVVLNYDDETLTLWGYSTQPIIVENKFLAYQVTFDLHSFAIRYTENTLSMNYASRIYFKGVSSFVDKSPYNIRYFNRREEIYLRSKQYFFKNLVSNTLEEANIRIYNRWVKIDPERYFITQTTPEQNRVLMIPGTNLLRNHHGVSEEPVQGVVNVLFKGGFRSEVVFLTNRFSVDGFGNPDNIDHFIFFGDLADQRLGDMLPMDFVPK